MAGAVGPATRTSYADRASASNHLALTFKSDQSTGAGQTDVA